MSAMSHTDHDGPHRTSDARGSPVSPATWPILIVTAHQLAGWSLTYSLRAHGLTARCRPPDSTRAVLESAGTVRAGTVLLDLDPLLLLRRDDGDGDPIDGVTLVAPLRAAGWQVLVVTGTTSSRRLAAARDAGAIGRVPKSASFSALLTAIRETRAGRTTDVVVAQR